MSFNLEVIAPTPDSDSADGMEGPLATLFTNSHECLIPTDGLLFCTLPTAPLQAAVMRHAAGHIIHPHRHLHRTRVIDNTQEVIIVMRGRIRVDLYLSNGKLETSRELAQGDMIILHNGGHGFVMLEDSELYEVKQGPYLGHANDKAYLITS